MPPGSGGAFNRPGRLCAREGEEPTLAESASPVKDSASPAKAVGLWEELRAMREEIANLRQELHGKVMREASERVAGDGAAARSVQRAMEAIDQERQERAAEVGAVRRDLVADQDARAAVCTGLLERVEEQLAHHRELVTREWQERAAYLRALQCQLTTEETSRSAHQKSVGTMIDGLQHQLREEVGHVMSAHQRQYAELKELVIRAFLPGPAPPRASPSPPSGATEGGGRLIEQALREADRLKGRGRGDAALVTPAGQAPEEDPPEEEAAEEQPPSAEEASASLPTSLATADKVEVAVAVPVAEEKGRPAEELEDDDGLDAPPRGFEEALRASEVLPAPPLRAPPSLVASPRDQCRAGRTCGGPSAALLPSGPPPATPRSGKCEGGLPLSVTSPRGGGSATGRSAVAQCGALASPRRSPVRGGSNSSPLPGAAIARGGSPGASSGAGPTAFPLIAYADRRRLAGLGSAAALAPPTAAAALASRWPFLGSARARGQCQGLTGEASCTTHKADEQQVRGRSARPWTAR